MRILLSLAFCLFPASALAQAPDFYCTGTVGHYGCMTVISTSDPLVAPVSGANDYAALGNDALGFLPGLMLFGVQGKTAIPLFEGTLCVAPPLGRGAVLVPNASSPIACDGQYYQLINDAGATSPNLDRGPGTTNWIQFWARDGCAAVCPPVLTAAVEVTFQ